MISCIHHMYRKDFYQISNVPCRYRRWQAAGSHSMCIKREYTCIVYIYLFCTHAYRKLFVGAVAKLELRLTRSHWDSSLSITWVLPVDLVHTMDWLSGDSPSSITSYQQKFTPQTVLVEQSQILEVQCPLTKLSWSLPYTLTEWQVHPQLKHWEVCTGWWQNLHNFPMLH